MAALGVVVIGTIAVLNRGGHTHHTSTAPHGVPPVTQTISQQPPICTGACARGGIHKIKHVVIIMQENRSFDNYFGTFPGADGIPMRHGVPTVCVPDPAAGRCVRPYHDRSDRDTGGPHAFVNSATDIDGGRMDGFIAQAERGGICAANDPTCGAAMPVGGGVVHRRHGLPQRGRDPELLDLREGLRPPGPHVRSGQLLEPARAPL